MIKDDGNILWLGGWEGRGFGKQEPGKRELEPREKRKGRVCEKEKKGEL